MVKPSMLRHLLSDTESLAWYRIGRTSTVKDVSRRLFLCERGINKKVPDHYYRLQHEQDFENIRSLPELITIGVSWLATTHLEMRAERIHVRSAKQNEWQQLITFVPPLLLQCAFLHQQKPLADFNPLTLISYKSTLLLPNFKYTALPYPFIPEIERYVVSEGGFHDIHMHLNGATETDFTWQDHLAMPKKIYHELTEGYKNLKVKEQFEQESHLLEPYRYYQLLLIARKIRTLLFDFIISKKRLPGRSANVILQTLINNFETVDIFATYTNPFAVLIDENGSEGNAIMAESTMYLIIFKYLKDEPREVIASLFHFYLLILGLCNRLLVQQIHQYGFEQFQKHTLNGLRETSEKQYRNRFFQLHGNEMRNLAFLEGRFSPKDNEKDTLSLLNTINSGWAHLKSGIRLSYPLLRLPELRLTAHFIKKKEQRIDDFVRYFDLRLLVWKKAEVLAYLKKNKPQCCRAIVGIDAAASEFDTPPEVFAPSFRMLRRKNFQHFTFHAGEDFFHLISGMRAIFEAISFNELGANDRIGHATAVGLSTDLWIKALGREILIRQGEWLDNLIFCFHLCSSSIDLKLKEKIAELTIAIKKYCEEVYNDNYTPQELESAWLSRKFCPIIFFKSSKADAELTSVWDEVEWNQIQSTGYSRGGRIYQAIFNYHLKINRSSYEKIITINSEEIFSSAELELLQKELLRYMSVKKVIIETLPTSNVRIGHHEDYSTYQLWNWFKWADEHIPLPPIVVGTDDTGIFATNIVNEFANIFCYLTNSGTMTRAEAFDRIKLLDNNSRTYRFT